MALNQVEANLGIGLRQKTNIAPSSTLVDFVFVIQRKTCENEEKSEKILTFLKNLQQFGMKYEAELGTIFRDLVFIKIYGGNNLPKYAKILLIDLTFQSVNYYRETRAPIRFLVNELTKPEVNSPLYQRAPDTFSNERPNSMKQIERIVVVYELLGLTRYGTQIHEYGINNLIKAQIVAAAYPLHNGQWEWTYGNGPLNDRQLLNRYWVSMKQWYKLQPINTIQNYFGPELAFYFAFFGFFNKMLISASVVAFLCHVFGSTYSTIHHQQVDQEICNNDSPICPDKIVDGWQFRKVSDSCFYSHLYYVFDNPFTIVFSIFMSFWTTAFMALWKRYHAKLLYHGNISSQRKSETRSEYTESAKLTKICSVTGETEHYIPASDIIVNYTISYGTSFVLVLLTIFSTIFLMFLRKMMEPSLKASQSPKVRKYADIILGVVGATVNVVYITVLEWLYRKFAYRLAVLENPRTSEEFEHSFITKIFLLFCINNYTSITYMVMVKGRLYTYPGDNTNLLTHDKCPQVGCMLGACIELAFTILIKSTFKSIYLVVKNHLATFWNYVCRSFRFTIPPMTPQWELDYTLEPCDKFFLLEEYIALIIQYGFVTFYVAVFPLTSVCALISNILKIRLDARRFTRFYQRPIPFIRSRMEILNYILHCMSIFSIVSNAFIAAFTSDFVNRIVYRTKHDFKLRGFFINYTMSRYDMADMGFHSHITCYYWGMRYPPEHPQKYQLTLEYWYQIAIRFLTAFLFEHIVIIINIILALSVPSIPHHIRKQINEEKRKSMDYRLQEIEGNVSV